MYPGFFEITPVDLDQLGAAPAVAVLREMLFAEINNLDMPISDTDIPYAITTADGGVDAVVKGTPKAAGNGLIFAPRTSYQVKAGNFNLTATSHAQIEKLLIVPAAIAKRTKAKEQPSGKAHKLDDVSPRIRECLDHGGTFVTMLFGNDNVETEEDATENAIRKFLGDIDPKYANAQIKVWRQSRICALLRQFPAVSLQIKNFSGLKLLSHDQWAERVDMQQSFVAASGQMKAIEDLRSAIRDDSHGSIHIRLIGEPGIGKTRLILETLRADDLRPLVCYADKATNVDAQVMSAIRAARHTRMILVVDECGPEQRTYLTSNFGNYGPELKIISIYQEIEESDRAPNYRLVEVPSLPDPEIESILASYSNDPAVTSNWAPYCQGSPRVAHVIGQNLKDHPDDPLRSDGTSQIWQRYIAAGMDPKSADYRDRHLVLCCLALFKKFGWRQPVQSGAYEIFENIIEKLDPGMSRAKFGMIIDEMNARKVLQGDNFLYITPRALHIKLWIDWWQQYARGIDVNDLVAKLSPNMRQWFVEMIEYAEAAPVAKNVVSELLGQTGPYANSDWLNTKEGGRFFFSLSLADPQGALRLLERTIGKMDRDSLLRFEAGRRDVIWALEGLALYRELFRPSAKLLLTLAEAENETWSNNATGVFAGLFSLGYGDAASTSLEPEFRLPILTDALEEGGLRAQVALKAFEAALSMQSITRWGNDQPFRFKKQVTRWTPKTYGEWFAAGRLYWKTLRNSLASLSADLRTRAIEILLDHTRELLPIEDLRVEILETLTEISNFNDTDRRKIISTIEMILHYDRDGMPEEVAAQLGALRDQMVGVSFQSRLRRYAGMDLLEDHFDESGKQVNRIDEDVRKLAEEALNSPDALCSELKWLVTDEAKNGYRFGHKLGQLDADIQAWPDIQSSFFAAGDAANDYFVGGYLRAIFERDPDAWQTIIFEVARTSRKPELLTGLVWRSGMTEDVAKLISQLVRDSKISPERLGIFSMGGASADLSDNTFAEWLDILVDVGSFTASATALNLASMGRHAGRKLTAARIEKILTQPALSNRGGKQSNSMLSHYWLGLARKLVRLDPGAEHVVLRTLLDDMGNSGAITAALGPEGKRFLDELVSKHPVEAWRLISEYIKPPMDTRGFIITRWLRGDTGFAGRNPGPMRHIPREEIWSWIEPDREARAPYVATMALKDFTVQAWKNSLIREILCRFGESEKVQNAVLGNFATGGWSGPASSHYATERHVLLQLKADETEPNALRWLDSAIRFTEKNLEDAKIEEEARGY